MKKIDISIPETKGFFAELPREYYIKLKHHLLERNINMNEWLKEQIDICTAVEGEDEDPEYASFHIRLTKKDSKKLKMHLFVEDMSATEWIRSLISQL